MDIKKVVSKYGWLVATTLLTAVTGYMEVKQQERNDILEERLDKFEVYADAHPDMFE